MPGLTGSGRGDRPGLVPAQLARAGQVWVSADSVSMVYEALTAGAAVGMLEVPRKRSSRISRGLDKLAGAGWVTLSPTGNVSHASSAVSTFNEAERCARWIVERWFA
ncbi:MAG: ELM1/GtrOC1 family putative glycosyltransferase [Candidatus Competibacteraceae bacterium]